MERTLKLLIAAAALIVPQSVLLAHHGQAAYAVAEPVTVKGTVTDFQFVNPHCIISLEATDEKGEAQKWQGELTSPNHLLRAGWNAHTIKPGDQIQITGWRAKSGANSLWITKTVLNGEELKTAAGD
jgi:DNA/RNA endonuclease YhcR with UshA esterase domain